MRQGMVTVADNGIGMSQEFQKHIFEPFERERTSTVSKVEGSAMPARRATLDSTPAAAPEGKQ